MPRHPIPEDTAKADESHISDEEWDKAATAHERFKALVETKPKAKARFDAVLAEITNR